MAEWRIKGPSFPDGLKELIQTSGTVASGVVTFLDSIANALDVVKTLAQGSLDVYSVIVNAFITETQNFLNDFKNAGVYVLVDYPQNTNISDFNPATPVNLAGTLLDARGPSLYTSDEDPVLRDVQRNDLQAIAQRRKTWNPVSKDIISYYEAVEHIAQAFDDIEDTLRPKFSDSANTVGVVLMVYSENVATFVRLVRTLTNIFAVDALNQILWPGFEDLFTDIKKSFDELTQQDFDTLDLQPTKEVRNGGRHPNFVLNTRIGDLIPVLGTTLDTLSALIEQFRPNGSITDFIQDIITALGKKIERINQIIFELEQLSAQMEALFNKDVFATVVIESNTGNNGFKYGLRNSTKHPEFKRALVCSILLYTGGPSAAVLKALFSSAGEIVPTSLQESLEQAKKNLAKPILVP